MHTTAQKLLDAQVAWHLDQLTGDAAVATLTTGVDDLLYAGSRLTVGQLVEPESARAALRLVFEKVPASSVASTVAGIVADVVHDGPARPFTAAELIDRAHVEALLDAALSRPELVAAVLDKVAESPMVASLASRFTPSCE